MPLSLDQTTRPASPARVPPQIRLGLIGEHIQKSRMPAVYTAEGHAIGLDLTYELIDPTAMHRAKPSLPEMIETVEMLGFTGVNVTLPYKKAVVEHLDDLSEAARRIGAVNTVIFSGGRRHGYNTDTWGCSQSLRQNLPQARLSTVLLLGAGGGGVAVADALKDLGADRILVFDRDTHAAKTLAMAVGGEAVTETRKAAAEADGIINTTPMGTQHCPGTPIDPDYLSPRHWIADIVYAPAETEFLHAARARGCDAINGMDMAVFQAVQSFSIFTGISPDAGRMHATFHCLEMD